MVKQTIIRVKMGKHNFDSSLRNLCYQICFTPLARPLRGRVKYSKRLCLQYSETRGLVNVWHGLGEVSPAGHSGEYNLL